MILMIDHNEGSDLVCQGKSTADPMNGRSSPYRLIAFRVVRRKGSKILATISCPRRLWEVERDQWASVLLDHFHQHWTARVHLTLLQRLQPVRCRGNPSRVEDERLRGQEHGPAGRVPPPRPTGSYEFS